MNESGMWRSMRKAMRGQWDATRHEDRIGVGIPDVSFGRNGVNGWIELKHMTRYPKRGPIRVPLRPEQIVFLSRRGARGKNCWIFLRVEKDHYLVSSSYAKMISSGITRSWLIEVSRKSWMGTINWSEFSEMISE